MTCPTKAKRRHCDRCKQPILADDFRWEASVTHEVDVFGRAYRWTNHLRCEIEEQRESDLRAFAAIEQAEKAGVA